MNSTTFGRSGRKIPPDPAQFGYLPNEVTVAMTLVSHEKLGPLEVSETGAAGLGVVAASIIPTSPMPSEVGG